MLSRVFYASAIASQENGDFIYLARAIDLFKIDLKTLQIITDKSDLTSNPLTPFGFATIIAQEYKEIYYLSLKYKQKKILKKLILKKILNLHH